jgi:hypothetical protein
MNDVTALHIEDNDEMSALEYAILSEASLPIIQMLQGAMVIQFRKRKEMDAGTADSSRNVEERQAKRQKCETLTEDRPKFVRLVSTTTRTSI